MNNFGPQVDNLVVNENFGNPQGISLHDGRSREAFIDELGYKNKAAPGQPSNWLRAGIIYNNSPYLDLRQFYEDGRAVTRSSYASYALYDRQLVQVAPSTAPGRGLFVGATAMYAPPESSPYSQNYEARLFSLGYFDARPSDAITLSYDHNVLSQYIVETLNKGARAADTTGALYPIFGNSATNTVTLTYTAHLSAGVYLTTGLAYTDHPAPLVDVRGTGNALNFLASFFTAF